MEQCPGTMSSYSCRRLCENSLDAHQRGLPLYTPFEQGRFSDFSTASPSTPPRANWANEASSMPEGWSVGCHAERLLEERSPFLGAVGALGAQLAKAPFEANGRLFIPEAWKLEPPDTLWQPEANWQPNANQQPKANWQPEANWGTCDWQGWQQTGR